MPESNFVNIRGEPIEVGRHGDHDFVFHEGDEVLDNGFSSLVFEAGTGLGGTLFTWKKELDGHDKATITIKDTTPNLQLKFEDTQNDPSTQDPKRPAGYTEETVSGEWRIEFRNVQASANSRDDNINLGVTTKTSTTDDSTRGTGVLETADGDGEVVAAMVWAENQDNPNRFRLREGGSDTVVQFSDTDWSTGHDFAVERKSDGSVILERDGTQVASIDNCPDENFHAAFTVHDDVDVSADENLSIDSAVRVI